MKMPTLTEHLAGQFDRHYPPANNTKTAGRKLGTRETEKRMPTVTKKQLQQCIDEGLTVEQAAEKLDKSRVWIVKLIGRHGLIWPGYTAKRGRRRPGSLNGYSEKDVHQFRCALARELLAMRWTREGVA